MKMSKTGFIISAIVLAGGSLSLDSVYSQTAPEMLLPLIEGNQYVLKEYDRKNDLKSSKRLKIGKIREGDQNIEIEIIVYNYDENATLLDSARTRLACSNSSEKMTMSLLAFLGKSGGGLLKLDITSKDDLFPVDLSKNEKLKDIRMEVKVKKGVFSFLGAKSKITIRKRKLTLMDSIESGGEKVKRYKLTSKLLIQAYVLRIKIKSIFYTVEETVDLKYGLVQQVARELRGGYFDLQLVDKK